MKCTAVFCENQATTIVKLKSTQYTGRVYCNPCVERVKNQNGKGTMFYNKLEYIPLEGQSIE